MKGLLSKLLAGVCASVLSLAACDAQDVSDSGDTRQRQMEFLNEMRSFDPQHEVIDRAIFNQANELGIIVNRTVVMEKIPPLMRTLLKKMAEQFPHRDLTILAYAPADPPLKIGTAHLDARTGDMSYSPEKQ